MLSSHRLRAVKHSKLSALAGLFFSITFLYTLWELTNDTSIRRNTLLWQILDKPIPRTIWYKLGTQGLNKEASMWADDCLAKNPGWRSEYMMEQKSDDWVRRSFSARPDVVQTYKNLTIPILRADLLRYLLLYHEGGMWFDLDVECGDVPIDEWVPSDWKANTSLIVGWEFDAGLPSDISHQINSWTILSRPGSAHMMQVIDDITQAIHDEASEHSVPVSELKLYMLPDVVDFTGPARLTRSLFRSLERTLGGDVDRRAVQGILKPKQLGDVVFMPGWAFAATQGEYAEEDRDKMGPRLVIHH